MWNNALVVVHTIFGLRWCSWLIESALVAENCHSEMQNTHMIAIRLGSNKDLLVVAEAGIDERKRFKPSEPRSFERAGECRREQKGASSNIPIWVQGSSEFQYVVRGSGNTQTVHHILKVNNNLLELEIGFDWLQVALNEGIQAVAV